MPFRLYNSLIIFISHHNIAEYIASTLTGTNVSSIHASITPQIMVEKAKHFENSWNMYGHHFYSYSS